MASGASGDKELRHEDELGLMQEIGRVFEGIGGILANLGQNRD
jgi:hypothetical protein